MARAIFGRNEDLDFLHQRVASPGVTVVAGPPKRGKSWLLQEFRDQLRESNTYLIGYKEGSRATSNLVLHSISELYDHWFKSSTFRQQAEMLIEKNRGKFRIASLGVGVAEFLKPLMDNSDPSGIFSTIARLGMKRLAGADAQIRSVDFNLEPIADELSRDMIATVFNISGKTPVLICDAFEQLDRPDLESSPIGHFLNHADEWASVHIIVGMRDNKPEYRAYTIASKEWSSPRRQIHSLGGMKLDGEEDERLLAYLRERVPGLDADDDAILEILDGHPGVLRWWEDSRPRNEAELRQQAITANGLRYEELIEEFERVCNDPIRRIERDLLCRLALLPEMPDAEAWKPFETIATAEVPPDLITSLQSRGILDRHRNHPSYGHTSCFEVAHDWWRKSARAVPVARNTAHELVIACASNLKDPRIESIPYVATLLYLGYSDCPMSLEFRDLARCAGLLMGVRTGESVTQIDHSIKIANQYEQVSAFVAMLLFNSLNNAKNDLARRDRLLEQLRLLGERFPSDVTVRMNVAMGLFNCLNYVIGEDNPMRRDILLEDLRRLAELYPDDASVRKRLANGLYNTLNDAKVRRDFGRRDQLLEQLKLLGERFPDDGTVRKNIAMCLFNTLNDAISVGNLTRCAVILEEMRRLAERFPNDEAVRTELAEGLYNAYNGIVDEQDYGLRDTLLNDLRHLANLHPEDGAVREQFAKGLLSSLIGAARVKNSNLVERLRGELSSIESDLSDEGRYAIRFFINTLTVKPEE